MISGSFKANLEIITEHVSLSAVPVNAAIGVPVKTKKKLLLHTVGDQDARMCTSPFIQISCKYQHIKSKDKRN